MFAPMWNSSTTIGGHLRTRTGARINRRRIRTPRGLRFTLRVATPVVCVHSMYAIGLVAAVIGNGSTAWLHIPLLPCGWGMRAAALRSARLDRPSAKALRRVRDGSRKCRMQPCRMLTLDGLAP